MDGSPLTISSALAAVELHSPQLGRWVIAGVIVLQRLRYCLVSEVIIVRHVLDCDALKPASHCMPSFVAGSEEPARVAGLAVKSHLLPRWSCYQGFEAGPRTN